MPTLREITRPVDVDDASVKIMEEHEFAPTLPGQRKRNEERPSGSNHMDEEGGEGDEPVFYTAKCSNSFSGGHGAAAGGHSIGGVRRNWRHKSSGAGSIQDCLVPEGSGGCANFGGCQDEEEESRLVAELPASLTQVHPSRLECTCFDPNCGLKRFFRYRSKQLEQQGAAQAAAVAEWPAAAARLGITDAAAAAAIRTAEERLVRVAGGAAICETVYECCANLAQRQQELLEAESSGGDTVLMQLCAREVPQEGATKQQQLLAAQIVAFVRLYAERAPELLTARNAVGTSALTLAALSDKVEVTTYLALLYGSEAANAANERGHTVLHLLARKGDECAGALEALLSLRENGASGGPRLMRLDIVNCGKKTPLDVAVACGQLFSTGRHRAIYDRVISLFHDVIEEDAGEMFDNAGAPDNGEMTFRNF